MDADCNIEHPQKDGKLEYCSVPHRVGCNPSGHALLLTRHERDIPAMLYEREPSFTSLGFFYLGHDRELRVL